MSGIRLLRVQLQQLDGDALVQLYDDTVTALLSEQIPVCRIFFRVRASSLWFDDECHTVKRTLWLSERAAHRVVFSRMPAPLPLFPTAPSTTVMSPSCIRWSPCSGPNASMLSSRSQTPQGHLPVVCTPLEVHSVVLSICFFTPLLSIPHLYQLNF